MLLDTYTQLAKINKISVDRSKITFYRCSICKYIDPIFAFIRYNFLLYRWNVSFMWYRLNKWALQLLKYRKSINKNQIIYLFEDVRCLGHLNLPNITT